MPPLSVLIKPSSSMCNMKCDYCFYCDEAGKRSQASFGFMSENTLKNVIRKTLLRAEGAIYYAFQGGEPTLRGLDFFKKVILFQQQYNKNRVFIHNSLQTNGFLLDEEWCRFLKDNNFLVGISVDGTPDIHNSLRHDRTGNSTFDRIEHSAALMDQYQVDYNILTVVTPQIAQNIRDIYSFYKKREWHYQQYIACLDPLEEGHGNTPHSLTPKIYGQFLIDLFDLWYKDVKKGKAPFIRQFDNYINIVSGYMPEACDQRGICGIQNVIEADGSVYPCDFYMLDDYCLGNFNINRLDEIDQKRKEIKFIERSQNLTAECRQCQYHWICRGGCQRNRDLAPENTPVRQLATNNPTKNRQFPDSVSGPYQNYFCESFRMFFDACLPRITTLSRI